MCMLTASYLSYRARATFGLCLSPSRIVVSRQWLKLTLRAWAVHGRPGLIGAL
ncbi:hypothetical protein B0H19DRAFT_1140610 [Mycena capillaripes]|nr:hypothetical protein B0H19DRAFT_1140610 [Mycena capillaripes]